MYSIRSTLILLGVIAVMLLILVSALLFHQKPRADPPQKTNVEEPIATSTILVTPTSTTERTETVPQRPPSGNAEIGSDFNMEFPTLDE